MAKLLSSIKKNLDQDENYIQMLYFSLQNKGITLVLVI